jgi:hypothetical protein
MGYFGESVDYDRVLGRPKDPKLFAAFTPEISAAMVSETDAFIREILGKAGGKLGSLLTADFTFVDAKLAKFYGLPAPAGVGFQRTPLPPGTRAGLLTQGSLMAALAHEDDTAPVARGRFVREAILCQPVPAPPPNVNAIPPPPDGRSTQRERMAVHSKDPTCAGCHARLDGVGLAFESYDAVGRFRASDAGKPIDTGGELSGVSKPARFANAADLGRLLAASPEASDCFVRRIYQYALGRAPAAEDECTLRRLATAFSDSGGDMTGLVVQIATSDAFLFRQR